MNYIIPTATERQLAALIVNNADSMPGPRIGIHEHNNGNFSVFVDNLYRDTPITSSAHVWLASTRTPEQMRMFKDAGAAINAARKLAQLAYPDQEHIPDIILQCRPSYALTKQPQ